jgi:hypothetical protein
VLSSAVQFPISYFKVAPPPKAWLAQGATALDLGHLILAESQCRSARVRPAKAGVTRVHQQPQQCTWWHMHASMISALQVEPVGLFISLVAQRTAHQSLHGLRCMECG